MTCPGYNSSKSSNTHLSTSTGVVVNRKGVGYPTRNKKTPHYSKLEAHRLPSPAFSPINTIANTEAGHLGL